MVGHQGIAPCIPVWKTGVFLSTLMPGEMELIVVVGCFKRRNNPAMTIPAELLQRLAAAKSVTVLTGAGVSAESGVPTFRDAQTGLWAKFSPEELATPRAFRRNPRLVWEWYEWRRKLVAGAKPNPAHLALAEMENLFLRFHLITQNVDGLHQRAGSRNVIELHGNITRTKCSEEGTIVSSWKDTGDVPPKCPACGGLLRPDVVWFEEPMPEAGDATGHDGEHALRLLLLHRHVHRCLSRGRSAIGSVAQRSDRGGDQSAAHTHSQRRRTSLWPGRPELCCPN